MAIDAAELLMKYSRGTISAVGNAAGTGTAGTSLGGQMGGNQITTATLNNLFDDVNGADNLAGDIEYRCFFFHNSDTALSLTNSRVYVASEVGSPGAGAEVAIALDTIGPIAYDSPSGTGMAAVVANENTSPGFTFTTPVDYATGLVVGGDGIVLPNEAFAVWVRRTADNSPAADPDGLVVRLEGDTLP
jgi:hypothetical protein